jgi:Domain of unknown function (DUF4340)
MKKSTLVILLLAAALGGYVYYTEIRNPKEKPAEDAPKPLYTFASDDVTSIHITRPGETAPVNLERKPDGWTLTSPVAAKADRTAADSVADTLAHAASERRLPADPARMKEFGLDTPAASVEIHLKNGQTQKLDLGAKDFSGMNVYARQAGAKEVVLVPNAVLTEVTRPLIDLRDRALLQLPSWSLNELDFHTPKAKFRLEKKDDFWNMTEPRPAPADGEREESLSSGLSGARFTDVVEEDAHDPTAAAKYGLTAPQAVIHVRSEQGAEGTLVIGKADGNKYFARDASRPMVFRIDDNLAKPFLDATFAILRDKFVLRAKADEFSQVSLHNEKQTIVAVVTNGKWLVQGPSGRAGKEFQITRIFDPLTQTRSREVIEHPTAAVLAKLAKPMVEIKLTGKTGGIVTVAISAKDGVSVYARSSRFPEVFRFDAYFVDQLNFSALEAAP